MITDSEHFDFTLDESDRRSAVWQRIETQLKVKLDHYRKKNDADLSPEKTAALRGRIRCLSEILNFGKERPPLIEIHQ